MNPRTFLQLVEESPARDKMVNVVYDVFVRYCQDEQITLDDISNEELEELAEGFVERGFGLPPSEETHRSQGVHLSDEELAYLKSFHDSDADYEYRVTGDEE